MAAPSAPPRRSLNVVPSETNVHVFDGWRVTLTKGSILSSQCTCNPSATVHMGKGDEHQFKSCGDPPRIFVSRCSFCRHQPSLKADHLPDMVFADNLLRIENIVGGFGLEFNAIDAVNAIHETAEDGIQVASASTWREARAETLEKHGKSSLNYDWTYTSDYKGTLFGDHTSTERSTEHLDMELISRKDPVLLFEDIQLYGDELDDNGCAEMNVRIRVVEDYLFVLLRFYLRVDHVMVRLFDTRVLLEKGKNHMLREFSTRESKTSALPSNISPMDPMQIWSSIPASQLSVDLLKFC